MINVNHCLSVCHGQVKQSSYSWHIHVDALLFQFEIIPLLLSAETLAFVLGIKLQLSRIQLIKTHRKLMGNFDVERCLPLQVLRSESFYCFMI